MCSLLKFSHSLPWIFEEMINTNIWSIFNEVISSTLQSYESKHWPLWTTSLSMPYDKFEEKKSLSSHSRDDNWHLERHLHFWKKNLEVYQTETLVKSPNQFNQILVIPSPHGSTHFIETYIQMQQQYSSRYSDNIDIGTKLNLFEFFSFLPICQ